MSVAPRTFLGFDYGERRIGVAVGQELTGTASPLTTLHRVGDRIDWKTIEKLIDEWRPDALVVGLPLNMDGSEHEMTAAARRFGRRLHGRFGLPVYEVDERLSSIEAEKALGSEGRGGKRAAKQTVDRIAAQIILQTWLDEQRG
ncbi:MAG: Holliday junction resolvase RuvX [Gammaproteobacteria bacterium]